MLNINKTKTVKRCMAVKKIIFVIVLCLSAFAACPAAYAKEAESGAFEITSGLDFSKDSVSTFDSCFRYGRKKYGY